MDGNQVCRLLNIMECPLSMACSATVGDTWLPLVRAYLCSLTQVVNFWAVWLTCCRTVWTWNLVDNSWIWILVAYVIIVLHRVWALSISTRDYILVYSKSWQGKTERIKKLVCSSCSDTVHSAPLANLHEAGQVPLTWQPKFRKLCP